MLAEEILGAERKARSFLLSAREPVLRFTFLILVLLRWVVVRCRPFRVPPNRRRGVLLRRTLPGFRRRRLTLLFLLILTTWVGMKILIRPRVILILSKFMKNFLGQNLFRLMTRR